MTWNVGIDNRLRRVLIYYVLCAASAMVICSAAVVSQNYAASLDRTYSELQLIQTNRLRLLTGIREKQAILAKVAPMVMNRSAEGIAEETILLRVDAIMSRMKGAAVVLGDFDRNESGTALSVTISGALRDYTTLLEDLRYLQGMNAPFFFIQTVTLGKGNNENEKVVGFEIKGLLRYPPTPAGAVP